jgi:hypothetical protein
LRRRVASAFPFFLLCHQALNLSTIHEQAGIRLHQHIHCGDVASAFRVKGSRGTGMQVRFLLGKLSGVFGQVAFNRTLHQHLRFICWL